MSLKDAPRERLIVDFDRQDTPVRGNGRKCDYLFIADGGQGGAGWVAPLELKRGALRASDVVAQLRAGAEIADGLVPGGLQPAFRPTVASGSIRKLERNALREPRNRIVFRGQQELVRQIKCGDGLIKALRK